jgi:mRNA-degrading endonuclease RelE of RelBE toxin-antitoxin system
MILSRFPTYIKDSSREQPKKPGTRSKISTNRPKRRHCSVIEQLVLKAEVLAGEEMYGLHVCGITTDASPLYPAPITKVVGEIPHQLCEFHILKELTRAVRRILQKLFSPNLEKALTFLDDRLLPSTSNAVERGNRRHRKMQKTVYRVRTQEYIIACIALDMLRDARRQDRQQTRTTLHYARAG